MLELTLLIALSINLYGRAVWLALIGQTLNPGVMMIAAPLAVVTYLWAQSDGQSRESSPHTSPHTSLPSPLSVSILGMVTLTAGVILSWSAYNKLAFTSADEWALWWRETGLILEGLGLICLWTSWTTRAYDERRVKTLLYPLSISIFSLPWESILRGLDIHLQRLSTDIAVYLLDVFSLFNLSSLPLKVYYWDSITIYSERFYLIINETCAGVNLLLSMSLYAIGFAWVMGAHIARAWILVAYIIPLCLLFNGFRVALIFSLGHFGDQELATGPWHEGSAYISQVFLFIGIALINHTLDRAPKSEERDP